MQPRFSIRNTDADFVEKDINKPVKVETFGGRLRLNESFLATIERSIEWMLWKRSIMGNYPACKATITGGAQKWDSAINWNGEFAIKKGDKIAGKGMFSASFSGQQPDHVLDEVALKVYKEDRDKIQARCNVSP